MTTDTATRASEFIRPEEAPWAIRVSYKLKAIIETIGKNASLLMLPLVFVTMWDVTARKVGILQIWLIETFGGIFESTLLQETEWHLHTGLFALVLGYGYVYNRHVRVDLIREKLDMRKQAWIEFLGCSFFMIPYCLIVSYFAIVFAHQSFIINEISASQIGLPYRWIIKTVLVVGLLTAALAGFAVWLQTVVLLFGRDYDKKRFEMFTLDWPEEKEERRISVEDDPLKKKLEESAKPGT